MNGDELREIRELATRVDEGQRVTNAKLDRQADKLQATTASLETLVVQMKYVSEGVKDHETRIRTAEQSQRPRLPVALVGTVIGALLAVVGALLIAVSNGAP